MAATRRRVETETTGEVADDRSICHVPAVPGGVGGPGQEPAGVCVCALRTLQGLAQSKASYHLRVLREAGLVREERREMWRFSTLDAESARGLLAELAAPLGA